MKLALSEVKTQAKKLLKRIKAGDEKQILSQMLKKRIITTLDDVQLKHCQAFIVQQLGFSNWHHAQAVLSGNANRSKNPDFGTIFYNTACGALLNLWFRNYKEAKQAHAEERDNSWLIPYKTQFIVVKKNYLIQLNIPEKFINDELEKQRDLCQNYNTELWDQTICDIIRYRNS